MVTCTSKRKGPRLTQCVLLPAGCLASLRSRASHALRGDITNRCACPRRRARSARKRPATRYVTATPRRTYEYWQVHYQDRVPTGVFAQSTLNKMGCASLLLTLSVSFARARPRIEGCRHFLPLTHAAHLLDGKHKHIITIIRTTTKLISFKPTL